MVCQGRTPRVSKFSRFGVMWAYRFTRSIRLGEHRAFGGEGQSGLLSTIASIPYFLIAITQAGWAQVERRIPFLGGLFTRREPYRQVPIDDDGECDFLL